jgi:hypothetical protein
MDYNSKCYFPQALPFRTTLVYPQEIEGQRSRVVSDFSIDYVMRLIIEGCKNSATQFNAFSKKHGLELEIQ